MVTIFLEADINSQEWLIFAKLSSSWQFQLKLSLLSSIISVPAVRPLAVRCLLAADRKSIQIA
jgi:hypothetical protein